MTSRFNGRQKSARKLKTCLVRYDSALNVVLDNVDLFTQ